MDSIQSSPLLRSPSRWRTYHRVGGTFSQVPGPLLIRLSQQAIEILTDEGRFLSDLLQSRKGGGRSMNWERNRILHRGSDILVLPNQSVGELRPSFIL